MHSSTNRARLFGGLRLKGALYVSVRLRVRIAPLATCAWGATADSALKTLEPKILNIYVLHKNHLQCVFWLRALFCCPCVMSALISLYLVEGHKNYWLHQNYDKHSQITILHMIQTITYRQLDIYNYPQLHDVA